MYRTVLFVLLNFLVPSSSEIIRAWSFLFFGMFWQKFSFFSRYRILKVIYSWVGFVLLCLSRNWYISSMGTEWVLIFPCPFNIGPQYPPYILNIGICDISLIYLVSLGGVSSIWLFMIILEWLLLHLIIIYYCFIIKPDFDLINFVFCFFSFVFH